MVGNKIHLAIILLGLCWTLAAAEEDINEDVIDDLEEVTLSYDFDEKFDKLVESVDILQKKLTLLENTIALRQANELSPHISSTAIGENSQAKLNILEVKCPNDRLPESCFEVAECKSDIYSIMIPRYSNHSQAVSCDLKTADGDWTVIQRRQDGSADFYRNWTEYVEGFGDVNGEFFIGLEKLHLLTNQENKPQELYIILEDFEGAQRYAKYQTFKIDSNASDYTLTVGKYSGNAGDSLTYHSGSKFSTWDRDSPTACVKQYNGAWWHKTCYQSNLNGKYLMGKLSKSNSGQGISWNGFRGSEYSLKLVKMMIRPRKD